MKKGKILRWLPITGLLVSMLGCHPAALIVPSYIQSVGVSLFENKTSYFGLDTLFTQAAIRQFQEDGRLPLVDSDKADLVVKAVIRQYVQEPQMYDPKTNYVLQYRLSVVYDLAAV
ncbi:MAG TPA: LPS assembly lipoprotein LptE, partial [bacterium]|nr:LPS assembly lipoprotein LptE [bacterium]